MVLSIEQVCDILGCKRSRVFQLLRTGVLERAPRYGRTLRIFKDSVDSALTADRPDTKTKRARKLNAPAPINRADIRF